MSVGCRFNLGVRQILRYKTTFKVTVLWSKKWQADKTTCSSASVLISYHMIKPHKGCLLCFKFACVQPCSVISRACPYCAWLLTLCLLSEPERGRLPSGSILGGRPDDYLLLHGSAVVRGRHRHLHRSHRQSEDGDRNIGPWRAAEVPGCEVRLLKSANHKLSTLLQDSVVNFSPGSTWNAMSDNHNDGRYDFQRITKFMLSSVVAGTPTFQVMKKVLKVQSPFK